MQCGDVEVRVKVRDRLTDQLGGVELDLVDGPMVDPTPQFLELLAREIGFVQRNLLRPAVIGGHRQIEVEDVDQGPHEVDDWLEHLRGRRGERPFLLGLLVRISDRVVLVHVVVLDQIFVERLGNGFPDDRLARGRLDCFADEERDAGLAGPRGQRLGDLALEAGHEVRVGLVGHDGQLIDVMNGYGVVHPLSVLVDGQPQAPSDLLAAGDGVVALLEHPHDEHVGVVPSFAQRRVGEDEPHWFGEREQPFLAFQDQVIGIRVGGLALVVAASGDLAVDLVLGLLVDGEVALVHLPHVVATQVGLILLGRRVDGEFAEHLVTNRGVLLLEHPRIVAESVLTAVVAVLGDLVDEEQREHLDALAEQLAFLVQMGTNDLTNLDAPLGLLGDVPVGQLPCRDHIAAAQLDHVAVRVDLGDEQSPVGLDPVRDIVKVRAHVETLDLPPDARCRLHLALDPRTRFGALRDLDGVQVQVGG